MTIYQKFPRLGSHDIFVIYIDNEKIPDSLLRNKKVLLSATNQTLHSERSTRIDERTFKRTAPKSLRHKEEILRFIQGLVFIKLLLNLIMNS